MKKIRIFLLLTLFALLLSALALSTGATGYNSVSANATTTAEKKLLTARAVTAYENGDVAGICAVYAVDKASLAELETKYNVTFGAIVARADHGFSQADLTPTYNSAKGALVAPLRTAMLTVYSTNGTQPVNATFDDDRRASFSVTLDLGEQTVERTECGVVNIAFVLLEDPTGEEAPKIYTVSRKGATYGTNPSFAAVKRFNYESKKEDTIHSYNLNHL